MGFLSRLLAMILKEGLQLARDRLTFAMMFGMPIMQLLLFGYAINNDPKGLPTAILAADQSAIDMLTAKGVIIVVAAGNENENVNKPKTPANCMNVITVGATGPTNKRAPYSNFGPRVDVMAPGGDTAGAAHAGHLRRSPGT